MGTMVVGGLGDTDEALPFFELSPDVCCILAPTGRFIAANASTERILGYSNHALDLINVLDLIHPEDEQVFARALEGLLSGKQNSLQFENRFRAASGAYRWLRWNASYHSGRILATAQDITESKANLERRYRRLFETAKDAILLIDSASGRILDLNRHTVEMTGFEEGELRGKEIWAGPPFLPNEVGRQLFEALKPAETFRIEKRTRHEIR